MVNSKSIFETGMEKLARILARQFSINVVFRGTGARTDGKTIYLPSVKDLSPELIKDINGFCDHEVAHCRYTDMPVIRRVPPRAQDFNRSLLNALEDVRVERLMIADYPGCEFNLEPLNTKYLVELYGKKWKKLEWPIRLILTITGIVTNDRRVPVLDAHLAQMIRLCKKEIAKFNSVTTTEAVLEISTAITNIVFDEMERQKKERERTEEANEGEGDNTSEPEEGDSGESDEGEESEGDEGEGKEPGEESESEGDEESDEGDSDEAGEGDSSEGNSDEEAEPTGQAANPATPFSEPTDEEAKKIEAGDEMMRGERPWKETSLDEFVNDEIKKEIKGGDRKDRSAHVPATTEFDTEVDETGKGSHAQYLELRKSVASHTAKIKKSFEKSLKVIENARWKVERERGKINQRTLANLVTQANYRTPFKELKKIDTTNVAIELLIDLSGSMDSRIKTAKLSVIAISEALSELGFHFEVTGFTSVRSEKVRARTRLMGDSGRYNRTTEALKHFIFKKFGNSNMNGITNMRVSEQNVDGESVRWAAKRLADQKQKRKILMVFSDGAPCADSNTFLLEKDLKESVYMIEKSGIEVVGVGIQTSSVKSYYKNNIVVNDLSDLPEKAMRELTKIILKNAAKK